MRIVATGDPFEAEIEQGLQTCAALIAVVSKTSAGRRWPRYEWRSALERYFAPVLVFVVDEEGSDLCPDWLAHLHHQRAFPIETEDGRAAYTREILDRLEEGLERRLLPRGRLLVDPGRTGPGGVIVERRGREPEEDLSAVLRKWAGYLTGKAPKAIAPAALRSQMQRAGALLVILDDVWEQTDGETVRVLCNEALPPPAPTGSSRPATSGSGRGSAELPSPSAAWPRRTEWRFWNGAWETAPPLQSGRSWNGCARSSGATPSPWSSWRGASWDTSSSPRTSSPWTRPSVGEI